MRGSGRTAEPERRRVAALTAVVVIHALWVVRDLSGPLVGTGDANLFELLGHYVREHVRFTPFAWVELATTDVGYPYGTSVAYLPWSAERDLLHAALLSAFGPGPWLQIYVAASEVVAALGAYVLLRREVGSTRAALAAAAATVMSFYTAFKYPIHVNLAVTHWTLLGIVADFVVARYVVTRRRLPALLVLLRIALLGLGVGLDLGYVAGFGLTSFTVTVLFLGFWIATRGGRELARAVLPRDVRAEIASQPLAFAAWLALLAAALLLYVPFDVAVVKASLAHPYRGAGGSFWAQWLRMLLPYFPGVHPGSDFANRVFGDPEGVGEYSIGWALLGAAALGTRDAWREKRIAGLVPALVTFLLCFAFHPTRLRTLHLFPWFAHDRVAGRGTLVFPLLAALAALHVDMTLPARKRLFTRALLPLAAVEILTACLLVDRPAAAAYTSEIRSYMEAVRATPGTGLFEWPLCIASADGTGTKELCPYYGRNATTFAFRRFHGKKTPSFYLGRMDPSQLEPWFAAGFPALFSPDDPDPQRARIQTRCFDERGWAAFTRFYEASDFAGIQLYVELEAALCVEEMHARFGAPTHRVVLPGVGLTELLPRRR